MSSFQTSVIPVLLPPSFKNLTLKLRAWKATRFLREHQNEAFISSHARSHPSQAFYNKLAKLGKGGAYKVRESV